MTLEKMENQVQTAINLEPLTQLKEEVDKEFGNAISNSNLGKFFESKGLIDGALKVKVVLDLDQIRKENAIVDPDLRDSLQKMPGTEFTIMGCCGTPTGCVQC
ncbi:MAG: hypothetical protein WBF90_34850 [Rivularia sp. (in: cyanobacteria)]